MIILVDFDGTCVTHEYPNIGKDIGAVKPLQFLVDKGHKLILFTMRDGIELEQAVEWFKQNDIKLYGIQTNPTQHEWTTSPKAYGHLIIDDICLGIDLVQDTDDYPYVDWIKTSEKLYEKGYLDKWQLDEICKS